jgi:transposase-like protein/ssDNA-binding Zn-finger/Zn-ribbon topoisomerase 1
VNSIVSFLFGLVYSLLTKIEELEALIETLKPTKPDFDIRSPKYKRFSVDKPPVVRTFEKQDYRELLREHERFCGKPLKPVARRGGVSPDSAVSCPYCGAPHEYLYSNDGGRGQMLCKVCQNRFSEKVNPPPTFLQCPYCGNTLTRVKDRKGFVIHKCVSRHCRFYKNSLAALSPEERAECKAHPYRFKLHYIYREFVTDFFGMDLSSIPGKGVNFNFRKFSPHILGLCLTYVVNCSLSFRQTQRVMLDVHGVPISHGMIARYVHTASAVVSQFTLDYDYKPTNYLAADETYVKVKGVNHYVWLVMDVIKKSIIGHSVSSTRNLEPCMLALRRAFAHFALFPGKALKFIADGYSVYKLAQLQFLMQGMDFDVTQVIGLTNKDPVSTEYRWLKQVIERTNRTFKHSYRVTNGYGSFQGADSHVAVFVACYNFLRPHSYTYWKPLNSIPELEKLPNMPAKWQKLIELSQLHLIKLQSA